MCSCYSKHFSGINSFNLYNNNSKKYIVMIVTFSAEYKEVTEAAQGYPSGKLTKTGFALKQPNSRAHALNHSTTLPFTHVVT